jgi:hypothetical protein
MTEAKYITVRVANLYGNEVIYPADDTAKLFAEIAGTKSLTKPTLELISKLGYRVVAEVPKVQLESIGSMSVTEYARAKKAGLL